MEKNYLHTDWIVYPDNWEILSYDDSECVKRSCKASQKLQQASEVKVPKGRVMLEGSSGFPHCLGTQDYISGILSSLTYLFTYFRQWHVKNPEQCRVWKTPYFRLHLTLLKSLTHSMRFCCWFVSGSGSNSNRNCSHSKIRANMYWAVTMYQA